MADFSIEQARKIVTSIPGPKSNEMHKNRLEQVGHGVGVALPVYIAKANGAILVDVDGNQFIDMGSGIGVTTIGHTNAGVVEAVSRQVAELTHTLFTVTPYQSYVEVCEILNRHMPGNFVKRSALFNSGAEAVENAVKLARKFTKRSEIAVFDHAYHGRTNLTMAMNFKNMPYADGFGPFAGSVTHLPMSYPFRDPQGMTGEEAAARAITYLEKRIGAHNLAALVIEPIQGEGGFMVPAPGFLKALSTWTHANGIVLVADEVQAGIARTGKWFASEYEEGFEPDLMTIAKGIAGGMPISAVTGRAEIMDSSHAGGIGGIIALRLLAFVKGADAAGGQIERGAQIGFKPGQGGIEHGGGNLPTGGGKIDPVEPGGEFGNGRIAARLHIGDDAGNGGRNIGGIIALGINQGGKGRSEIGGGCVKPLRHRAVPQDHAWHR